MIISLNSIDFTIGGKVLLKDMSLTINDTDRIGLTGRNGSGKSQLLKIVSGKIEANAGTRDLTSGKRIEVVAQTLPASDEDPIQYLKGKNERLQALYDTLADPDFSGDFGAITDESTEIEELYDTQGKKILLGLGLRQEHLRQSVSSLSEGLRMRINIASALLNPADLLILDEPTNHLDLEATQWLTQFLMSYPSALLLVSHDPALLNAVTTKTLHLKFGKLTSYSGDFDTFIREQDIKTQQAVANNQKHKDEAARLHQGYLKFRAVPSQAGHAMDLERRAKEHESKIVTIIPEEPIISIDFGTEVETVSDPAISLQGISLGYDGRPLLTDVTFDIQHGSRIGILGCNGQGKSTLVKSIMGKLDSMAGTLTTQNRLKIGYYSQAISDEFDLANTVIEQIQQSTTVSGREALQQYCAKYGFSQERAQTPITGLSGGERARLAFAIICSQKPNCLVLDEPTNHLDMESRSELINALSQFKGTIILISHDAELHQRVAQQFYVVKDGSVLPFVGNIERYQQSIGLSGKPSKTGAAGSARLHHYSDDSGAAGAAAAGAAAAAADDQNGSRRRRGKRR